MLSLSSLLLGITNHDGDEREDDNGDDWEDISNEDDEKAKNDDEETNQLADVPSTMEGIYTNHSTKTTDYMSPLSVASAQDTSLAPPSTFDSLLGSLSPPPSFLDVARLPPSRNSAYKKSVFFDAEGCKLSRHREAEYLRKKKRNNKMKETRMKQTAVDHGPRSKFIQSLEVITDELRKKPPAEIADHNAKEEILFQGQESVWDDDELREYGTANVEEEEHSHYADAQEITGTPTAEDKEHDLQSFDSL